MYQESQLSIVEVLPVVSTVESVQISAAWQSGVQIVLKRVLDVLVATTLLILLSPFFAALAILIKLTSKGPIFYRWHVMGKNGRPFVGYKFRSMVRNADDLKTALKAKNEMNGPFFKMTDDPRITKLGRWMRRYSVDELPQLYSVLTGQMSLVGPRPPLVTEYEQFTDLQKCKLLVKPGITCLWQVNGRNQICDFKEWLRLDLEYIRAWSIWLDARILFKTAAVMFAGTGK